MFYYNKAMSILTTTIPFLPSPIRGSISLVIAPRQAIESLTTMLVSLALNGQVTLVDGGNLFDGYRLTRMLRMQTTSIRQTLDNICLSRVFTCYQMVALLKDLPADGPPVIIFDLFATYLDESVSFSRRRELLATSLSELQRINTISPIALWVRLRSVPSGEDKQLLTPVLEIAQDIWQFESPRSLSPQLSLF